jgi:hypothetical protein
MRIPDHQLAFSARFLRRPFVFAGAALLLLCSSANAGTVLQFGQINPADIVTATDSSGTTTLSTTGNVDGAGVSIPVVITNFLGASVLIPAFETYVGVTSVGPAVLFMGQDFQAFAGTIEFTSVPGGIGATFLSATFAGVGLATNDLFGANGGSAATLSASEPPASLVLTSVFAVLPPVTSMGIGFSNLSPAMHIASDGSIASFTGQNTGTFSSSSVPEPGTLSLASVAVVVLGTLAYARKRIKDEPEKARSS